LVDKAIIYISAAGDLHPERDLISRTITEIPVTLGWEIHLSPIRERVLNIISIEEADIHLLLLGQDIQAPIGQEWFIAKRAGRIPELIYKDGISRTPAALDFYRTLSRVQIWQAFDSLEYLRHITLKSICSLLLSRSSYYEFDKTEVENLSSLLNELNDTDPKKLDEIHRGTGENSVILSPERYIPSTGVLIEHSERENDE
jgi:hypothetical protein